MNKNISNVDKIVRFVLGAAIIGAGIYYQNYWGALGLVPLVTAAIGWCPAYAIFGISSCKTRRVAHH